MRTSPGAAGGLEPLAHVFERFARADAARDRRHGGSGIGLAISRALVLAHGGTIVGSSPGVGAGSVFTVTLPNANDLRPGTT